MLSRTLWLAGLALTGLAATPAGIAAASSNDPKGDAGIEIKAALDRNILKSGETQKAFVRIAIGSQKSPRTSERAPMNVAVVIDRSGSMSGARIEAAREAAAMAVDRLSRNDILSVVSYDDRVEVEVPATKLTDPARAKDRIRKLTSRGSTAIYAGLQAGADEIRKFKSRERVSRIILLSDGLANVGPSSPRDFAGLGRELASEGMTVSTVGLGLGYNEDLMSQLAINADGSHAFVQEPADLAAFFAKEFNDALGIVAQDVEIIITFLPGLKPMRSLGRDGVISGNSLKFKVNQLVGGAEQVLLAEFEVPAGVARDTADLATVKIAYSIAGSNDRKVIDTAVSGRFGTAPDSDASVDHDVMKDVTALVARAERQEAIRLRDAGKLDEAQRKFEATASYLRAQQGLLPQTMQSYAPIESELKANEAAAAPAAATAAGWAKARKQAREVDSNQSGASTRY